MLKFNRILLASALAAALISASVMNAQTAEPSATVEATVEASADKTVVLDALHALLTESYHFRMDNQLTLTITGASNPAQTSVTLTNAEGDVAPSETSHMTLTVKAGETLDAAQTGPHGTFERIIVDGVTYVNVDDNFKDLLPINVDAGWYKLDDLVSKLESNAIQAGLKSIAQSALPSKLVVPDSAVLDVTEVEPQADAAAGARVFDVKFDGAALAVAQTPGSPVDKIKELFQNSALYAASKFDYAARVTINADGKIVQMHGDGHTFLPYLTVGSKAGLSGLPSYDIDQVNSTDITITNYGQAVEITAPDTVE